MSGELRWIDPARISAIEDRVRREQEELLADVLARYDELTALFVPHCDERRPRIPAEHFRALVALESGLFGHVRSVRAAVRDGQVQDVAALGRTLDEIRRKAAICVADASFAARHQAGVEISMTEVDRRFRELREREGRPEAPDSLIGARLYRRTTSAVIHATQEGLGFMAQALPSAVGIVRDPAARRTKDRGRLGAVVALSFAANAVGTLIPTIFGALELDAAPWWERWREFDRRLASIVEPYALRVVAYERQGRRLTVGERGQLLEGQRALTSEEIDDLRQLNGSI